MVELGGFGAQETTVIYTSAHKSEHKKLSSLETMPSRLKYVGRFPELSLTQDILGKNIFKSWSLFSADSSRVERIRVKGEHVLGQLV